MLMRFIYNLSLVTALLILVAVGLAIASASAYYFAPYILPWFGLDPYEFFGVYGLAFVFLIIGISALSAIFDR